MITEKIISRVVAIGPSLTEENLGEITLEETEADFAVSIPEPVRLEMLAALARDHAVLIRQSVSPERIKRIFEEGKGFIRSKPKDLPLTGNNWQRVIRWVHLRKPQVRTSLSIYPPAPGLEYVSKLGRLTVRIRNALHAWPADLGIKNELGEFASINMSHYPYGGGFMVEHRDVDDEGTVCTLSLTERGRQYATGGIYARTEAGEFIDLDAISKQGDFYLIRANMRHGVAPIDPEQALDWHLDKGRWILFAPLQGYNEKNPVLIR